MAVPPASTAPGTGTPEIGGLTVPQALEIIRGCKGLQLVGADLVVTLTNTSSSDVLVPADVLTAMFFDVVGFAPLNLTPDKAVLGDSAVVLFGPQPAGGVVGGEWTYESGLIGAPDNVSLSVAVTLPVEPR